MPDNAHTETRPSGCSFFVCLCVCEKSNFETVTSGKYLALSNHVHPTMDFQFLPFLLFSKKKIKMIHRLIRGSYNLTVGFISQVWDLHKRRKTHWELKVRNFKLNDEILNNLIKASF